MYLIPSFIIIPLIILVLVWLNKRFEKKQKANIDRLISPTPKDALFNAPRVSKPQPTQFKNQFDSPVVPVVDNSQSDKIAKQKRVQALKAELARIQQKKQQTNSQEKVSTTTREVNVSKNDGLSNRHQSNLKKIAALKLALEKAKQSKQT